MQQVAEGTVQRNKRTGEVRVFQGGQWVSQGAPQAAPQGPVTLGTPRVDPFKVRDQELQEAAARRAEEDQQFQRQKFEREMAKPVPKDGDLGVAQSKAAGFLARAEKANQAYEATGVGSQDTLTTAVRAITPDTLEPLVIGPERQQAEANVRAFISSVLRYESGAAIPPEEFESAYKTYFPQPNEDPETAKEKARLRAEAIEAIRLGAGQEPAPQAVPVAPAPQDVLTPSTSGTRTVDNPELAGVRGEYLKRLAAGQSASQIISFLKKAGVNDPMLLKTAVEQVKYRKAHPEVPIEKYNVNSIDDMDVPLTSIEDALNKAAQTTPGAYAMRAGNAVTGNNLDSIIGATGGNQERASIALNDAGQAHPVASFAGDMSGGVMAALMGEAGLARAGMASGLGRAALADTGYGAVAGAGASDDGNRAIGALLGAGAGLAGSLGGQAVAKGVGNAISPTGGGMNRLYETGVRPTPGQRFGDTGVIGKTVNAAEEGLQSIPVVGSAIRNARQDARDQFQVGAFNEALKEVGTRLPKNMKPGTAPHAYAQRVFDDAYNKAREGLRVQGDDEMAKQVTEMSADIKNLAEPSAKRFNAILENVVMRRAQNDVLEGAAYKKVQIDLGKTIRGIRKSPSGDGELADALEQLQSILDDAARRHSDPEAIKALDAADRGYAKLIRIRDAAKARGGDDGTFSPVQFDRAVQKNARGPRSEEYLRGEALMQDYANQAKGLSDKMPNSGTTDRGLLAAGVAGYVEPTTLGLLGALGLAYAPGVNKLTKGAMTPRPKLKPLADKVRKRSRIAGAVGAQTAIQTSGDR